MEIQGVKFNEEGNLIKPKILKTIKIQTVKLESSDILEILQPQQVELKNGVHILCRFCGKSHFKLSMMLAHIRRKHKTEFAEWFINSESMKLYSLSRDITTITEIERQLNFDRIVYILNQIF